MSKPLAISAALAVFTMAAFAVFATPSPQYALAAQHTGATTWVAAPAVDRVFPAFSELIR